MAEGTVTKSLKDMSLVDLVLSKDSLDNIVENNELNERLQNYATVENLTNNVEAIESKLSGYAALSNYENLLARVEQLEFLAQQTSSYAVDKDRLCGAAQQLCIMLGGISISVVDEYDANLATDGTIYFVKSSENDTLSAMHFIPKINIDDNSESSSNEQPLTDDPTIDDTSPKMQFTSIKSTSTSEGTIKKGEAITISGNNLLDLVDVPSRYSLSVATFKQPSGMDAMMPVIKTFVEVQNWTNDNEQHDSWTDFTNDQITIPASIWETTLNTEAINDGLHDNITIILQKFKNDVLVDQTDITASITVESSALAAEPKTRKRKNK